MEKTPAIIFFGVFLYFFYELMKLRSFERLNDSSDVMLVNEHTRYENYDLPVNF